MIRPAEVTGPTFQPYAPTNRELYEEISDHITLHELLNTMPYTTLTSYADSLGIGEHLIFVQNNNILTDVPFNNSSAIVVVRAYSANTAMIDFIATSTTYQMYRYSQIKTSGMWRGWYRFTGEAVTTVQSVPTSLMQAWRIDAELTDAGTYDTLDVDLSLQSGTRSLSMQPETLTKGSSEPEVIEDEKEMEVKE